MSQRGIFFDGSYVAQKALNSSGLLLTPLLTRQAFLILIPLIVDGGQQGHGGIFFGLCDQGCRRRGHVGGHHIGDLEYAFIRKKNRRSMPDARCGGTLMGNGRLLFGGGDTDHFVNALYKNTVTVGTVGALIYGKYRPYLTRTIDFLILIVCKFF